jgi:hypothetical protein
MLKSDRITLRFIGPSRKCCFSSSKEFTYSTVGIVLGRTLERETRRHRGQILLDS